MLCAVMRRAVMPCAVMPRAVMCPNHFNAAAINCLQRLFVKAKRWKIVSDNYDVSQLFDNCDDTFKIVIKCLRYLYPDKRRHVHSTLRTRGHNFSLPKCRLQITRNSLINRILFACVYNVQFVFFF